MYYSDNNLQRYKFNPQTTKPFCNVPYQRGGGTTTPVIFCTFC